MSGLEEKAENSGSIGWVRTALVGNVFPDVRYGDFKKIADARKAIGAIRKEVYSTKHLDEVWESLNTQEHTREILERSPPLAAEWRAWDAAGRVDKKLEAKLNRELNKESIKEHRELLAAEIAERSKEHLAVIKKYSTIDAADLHSDSAERENLREQLKPRSRRVLAWILGFSSIFLPLIILGPILYGVAFPSFIAGLGFGFAAVFGVAAAATPAGWALLSLVIAAVAILGVIGIVRIGFELAARFNWGGRLAVTPYQSMLAMITPREKSALNFAGQVEMVSQQHLTTGEESILGPRLTLDHVAAASMAPPRQSIVVAPKVQETVASMASSNQSMAVTVASEVKVMPTQTDAPGQSVAGCLKQMKEHLAEIKGMQGILFLTQNIRQVEANAGDLAYVVAQLTEFQKALSTPEIKRNNEGGLIKLNRDFDAVIVAMLRSPSAADLFKPGCIERFSTLLKKEHLDGLNAGELSALSDKLSEQQPKQGSKPGQPVEVTRAVQVVKGLLDTALEARPESSLGSKV